MKTAISLLALVVATFAYGGASQADAQTRKPGSCKAIYNICMKRAGAGHAAICEDMYRSARANGEWQETIDENGVKRPPVPCTP
ncbi:MAG: hypothetical protein ACK5JM_13580 [Rhodoblastus sp.]